jgi:hypothetical protein
MQSLEPEVRMAVNLIFDELGDHRHPGLDDSGRAEARQPFRTKWDGELRFGKQTIFLFGVWECDGRELRMRRRAELWKQSGRLEAVTASATNLRKGATCKCLR